MIANPSKIVPRTSSAMLMTIRTTYLFSEMPSSCDTSICGSCSRLRISEKTEAEATMNMTPAVVSADSRSRS